MAHALLVITKDAHWGKCLLPVLVIANFVVLVIASVDATVIVACIWLFILHIAIVLNIAFIS